MSQRPLFLLSLPRSGSTLVQRVLAVHEQVDTTPEPWILLPQLYALREWGAYAEYGHASAARAILEFAGRLPRGEEDYFEELAAFVRTLYAKASNGRGGYFLDKTPRYHFVVDELFRVFPDAKFVFLWRNPLAVVASIVQTWTEGRWNLERWHRDLFDGVANLVAGYEGQADRSLAIRYEDLVSDPDVSWPRLHEYLGIRFDPEVLTRFAAVRLQGRMGDPTGSREYETLSTEPLSKWRSVAASPVRKRWCRRYLEHIGAHRLGVMGYDLDVLLRELDEVPTSTTRLASDAALVLASRANRVRRETAARLMWRRAGPTRGSGAQSKGQTSSP